MTTLLAAEVEELNRQIAATTSPSGGYLTPDPRSVADIKTHLATIMEVMRDVMKPGIHYGTIPGCGDRPTLLKPGAEILKTTFKLSDKLVCEKAIDCGEEINYRVTALITHAPTGIFVGSGVGECSTLETKYAWREAVSQEEFNATPETHRRQKFWRNRKTKETGKTQQVRTIPADQANTVLKMAVKRALVASMLNCTACSNVFTQDIEDMDRAAFRTEKTQRETAQRAGTSTTIDVLPPFGNHASQPIAGTDRDTLEWYRVAVERNVNDPAKVQYFDKNKAMLAAITAELAARPAHAENGSDTNQAFINAVSVLNQGEAVRTLLGDLGYADLTEVPDDKQAEFIARATALARPS